MRLSRASEFTQAAVAYGNSRVQMHFKQVRFPTVLLTNAWRVVDTTANNQSKHYAEAMRSCSLTMEASLEQLFGKTLPPAPSGYQSPWQNDETRIFRHYVREFIAKEFAPHEARWDEQGHADREAWRKAGQLGMLLPALPEIYGGGGTFALEAVVIEELARSNTHIGFGIQSIVGGYILAYGSDEQKRRWLPRMASGELIAAIGITEPNSGSNLQSISTSARREADHYRIDGSKTFITNGSVADLICLAVRTDPFAVGPRALSLLMVETKDLPGFQVGRAAAKIGRHAQNTCELFFDGARVPVANLLGPREGHGLLQMMDQLRHERLAIGLSAIASAERAVEITTTYVKERKAYGKTLIDLQNTRFKLAECKSEAHIGRVFVDHCIQQHISSRLDDITAAMAKYWLTELEGRVVDQCVQMHGGYGYMRECLIARMWADSRVQRIYAGSNEVMKDIIGFSL